LIDRGFIQPITSLNRCTGELAMISTAGFINHMRVCVCVSLIECSGELNRSQAN